jgi:Luciferase-like monooxygenase
MLDESLEILAAAWSGEPVHHRGKHYTVDGMHFLPRLVQPGVPVWVAGSYGEPKPLRRAARHQGFFPVNLEHADQLAEIVADLTVLRTQAGKGTAEPYDVVAALPPGTDPAQYFAAGATWWIVEFPWDAVSVDQVLGVIREGPATAASWNAGGVCRQPMGQLPGAAQRDVVAAVHLVGIDAETLTCVPARPCGREHAVVTAEEVPRGACPANPRVATAPAAPSSPLPVLFASPRPPIREERRGSRRRRSRYPRSSRSSTSLRRARLATESSPQPGRGARRELARRRAAP